eukprot:TRINITY_DN6147_c0_g2_i2.p1 TRINITY_DN6147_c0_g2~~TRINITY_DN6147_c0_g2_i2.p1  ORF type:complete len:108 (+),score=38.43 TRINITY_DN6147_c0_g2_i2:46-369(+)
MADPASMKRKADDAGDADDMSDYGDEAPAAQTPEASAVTGEIGGLKALDTTRLGAARHRVMLVQRRAGKRKAEGEGNAPAAKVAKSDACDDVAAAKKGKSGEMQGYC